MHYKIGKEGDFTDKIQGRTELMECTVTPTGRLISVQPIAVLVRGRRGSTSNGNSWKKKTTFFWTPCTTLL